MMRNSSPTAAGAAASTDELLANRNTIKGISLFSGIAGFELGMEPHGHEPILFCEIEPSAGEVIQAWRPGVPLHRDVRLLDELPADGRILTAGFPCTDISPSGRTAGIFGEQSGLVRDVFRLLGRKRIEWVVLENVLFLLSLHNGIGIAYITQQLEALGYRWAYRVVDSLGFGVPQRRRRVFIVASLHHDPREVLLADDAGPLPQVRAAAVDVSEQAVGFYWTEGRSGLGLAVDAVPPLKAASTVGIPSPPAIMLPDGTVGTPDIRDAERMQGLPSDWTAPGARFGRNVRWRLVGNAVTRDIPDWLARRMAEPARYDSRRDREMRPGRWPKAAWNMGTGVHVSGASENPLGRPQPMLRTFLRHPLQPLSARATRGFLARARAGSLTFPAGFLERLDAHHDRMQEVMAA